MSKLEREQLVELFKKAQFFDNYSQGQITVDSPKLVQYLELAFEHADITGWQQLSINDIKINQTYKFYYEGTRSSDYGHFFKTTDSLLNNNFFRANSGKKFFIIDIKYDSRDVSKPAIISKYEDLLRLVQVLKSSSAFFDSQNSKMLFLHEGKLEIEPIYSQSDLMSMNGTYLDKIINFIEENTHKSQKLAILSKAIIDLCKNEDSSERFKLLLSNLESIYKTLDHDFALFSSNFSYEKLRSEIENSKLEEKVKIHKVITDIQNQILGIPIATVIVATQFKTVKSVENDYAYQFYVNTGITVGVIIFTIFMIYMLINQAHSLNGIETEILRKDHRFKTDSKIVYQKINDETGQPPYADLLKRIKIQKIILWTIGIICGFSFLVTLIIYACITVYP